MIPFLELKPQYEELRDEFDSAYQRVMESGWFLLGEETESFEQEYATYCGVDHCVTVGSGLDALTLLLKAHGIGNGDEVIVPSHTFIATWLAVSNVGATPIPVEPFLGTANIDPDKIEPAINARTRAIIPVHLYGQPADMNQINEVASKHDLIVIEDAAQSQGATFRGVKSGALGHAAAHSFYPGKNLGAFGDGGAVTTNDSEIAKKVRLLRNYGSEKKYYHEVEGVNSRLDELQAAFLKIKLRHLDLWNQKRKRIATYYIESLKNVSGLKLPEVNEHAESVWHLFVVRHPDRDRVRSALKQAGVSTLIHYPIPCHLSSAYSHLNYDKGDFPFAEELSREVLSLPIGPHQEDSATQEIINVLLNAI